MLVKKQSFLACELVVVVVLDNIRSTFNVGSIFRTADASGVFKIFLCGLTPCPPNSKISKVALGAENYISWEKIKITWQLLKRLKKEGYFLIALEQNREAKDIFSLKATNFKKAEKIALILGSETKGISPKILKRTNLKVFIPMFGEKESLNVSVAFGVAIYQLRRILYNK